MSQSYPDVAATDLVSGSRSKLLDRDNALRSNFAGTTFPTTNLLEGQGCYRTDLKKLYVLEQASPAIWREVALSATLGTASAKNTGTSGDAVPLLNAANTWSALQTLSAGLAIAAQALTTSGGTLSGNDDLRLDAAATKNINLLINGTSKATLNADGGFVVGSAIGGSKGDGTLNALALYQNGTAIGTAATRSVGTNAGQIPAIENLGALALKNTIDNLTLVADGLLSLAKMRTGTANTLMGYNGSGAPVEITAGSNITISGGAISAGGSVSSGWTKISNTTGSGVKTISLPSGYRQFKLFVNSIYSSSGALLVRVSDGSTVLMSLDGAAFTQDVNVIGEVDFSGVGCHRSGELTLIGAKFAGSQHGMAVQMGSFQTTSSKYTKMGYAIINSQAPLTSLSFLLTYGSIASCDIDLWGIT